MVSCFILVLEVNTLLDPPANADQMEALSREGGSVQTETMATIVSGKCSIFKVGVGLREAHYFKYSCRTNLDGESLTLATSSLIVAVQSQRGVLEVE